MQRTEDAAPRRSQSLHSLTAPSRSYSVSEHLAPMGLSSTNIVQPFPDNNLHAQQQLQSTQVAQEGSRASTAQGTVSGTQQSALLKQILPLYISEIIRSISLEQESSYDDLMRKYEQELSEKDKQLKDLEHTNAELRHNVESMRAQLQVQCEQGAQAFANFQIECRLREEHLQNLAEAKTKYWQTELNTMQLLIFELKNFLLYIVRNNLVRREDLQIHIEPFKYLFGGESAQLKQRQAVPIALQEREVLMQSLNTLREEVKIFADERQSLLKQIEEFKSQKNIAEQRLSNAHAQMFQTQHCLQLVQEERIDLLNDFKSLGELYEGEIARKSERHTLQQDLKEKMIDNISEKYMAMIDSLERESAGTIKRQHIQQCKLDAAEDEKKRLELQNKKMIQQNQNLQKKMQQAEEAAAKNYEELQRQNQELKDIQAKELDELLQGKDQLLNTTKNEYEQHLQRWKVLYQKLQEKIRFLRDEKSFDEVIDNQIFTLTEHMNLLEKRCLQQAERLQVQEEMLQSADRDIEQLHADKQKMQDYCQETNAKSNENQAIVATLQGKLLACTRALEREKKINIQQDKECDRLREMIRFKEKENLKTLQMYEKLLLDERTRVQVGVFINDQGARELKVLVRQCEEKAEQQLSIKIEKEEQKRQTIINELEKVRKLAEGQKWQLQRSHEDKLLQLEEKNKQAVLQKQKRFDELLEQKNQEVTENKAAIQRMQEQWRVQLDGLKKNLPSNAQKQLRDLDKITGENQGKRLHELLKDWHSQMVDTCAENLLLDSQCKVLQEQVQRLEQKCKRLEQENSQGVVQQLGEEFKSLLRWLRAEEKADEFEYKAAQKQAQEQEMIRRARQFREEFEQKQEGLQARVRELERGQKQQLKDQEKHILERYEELMSIELRKHDVFVKQLQAEFENFQSNAERMLELQKEQYDELFQSLNNSAGSAKAQKLVQQQNLQIKELKTSVEQLKGQLQQKLQKNLLNASFQSTAVASTFATTNARTKSTGRGAILAASKNAEGIGTTTQAQPTSYTKDTFYLNSGIRLRTEGCSDLLVENASMAHQKNSLSVSRLNRTEMLRDPGIEQLANASFYDNSSVQQPADNQQQVFNQSFELVHRGEEQSLDTSADRTSRIDRSSRRAVRRAVGQSENAAHSSNHRQRLNNNNNNTSVVRSKIDPFLTRSQIVGGNVNQSSFNENMKLSPVNLASTSGFAQRLLNGKISAHFHIQNFKVPSKLRANIDGLQQQHEVRNNRSVVSGRGNNQLRNSQEFRAAALTKSRQNDSAINNFGRPTIKLSQLSQAI